MVYSQSLLLENAQANIIRKYFGGIVVGEHVKLENYYDIIKFNP
jgi:hypothetical protein